MLLGSCSGSSGDGGSATDPCKEDLADLCGTDCTSDLDCPSGLFCSGDQCTADCVPGGGQCSSSQRCNERGRCEKGGQLIGVDGGGGSGGFPSSDACVAFNVGFEKQIPTVILLIDQSGSMTNDFGGKERWDAIRDSLMDPNNGLVKALENDIRFGLALYTSFDGNSGGACPRLTEVAIKLGNYDAINTVFQAADAEDETPTGESIALITPDLAAYPEPGDKAIVLATDGEPDTCAEPNPQNGQPETIAAVNTAFAEGIRTFVISVGSGVSDAHLQDVANAGQGNPSTDAPFWVANDQSGLQNAFQTIINGFRSCVFDLDGAVEQKDWNTGTVTLDGSQLPYDDPNGWRMNSNTELELVGDACETIKDGSHNLDIQFPCGAVVPIPM